MTVLSQKMLEDLQLRGLAARTQDSYVSAVRQLAKHYHKSPDKLDEEELRQYFLYLKNVSRCRTARFRLRCAESSFSMNRP
jgi:integrase/recombinase XerD